MADDLTFLLRDLIEEVPGTRCAVLLSVDGIAKFSYGIGDEKHTEERDTLAAVASGMCSLAQQAGRFGKGSSDGVRQVVAELDESIMFVTSASRGSVIVVLADRAEVNVKDLGFRLAKLCKQVPAFMATPSRYAEPAGNGPI